MQLKMARSQKTKGMMSKTVLFCLDARAEYSPQERDSIRKYGLGGQILWNSAAGEKAKQDLDGALVSQSILGTLKNAAKLSMSLKITMDSLGQGHHIETESLDELIGAEEAIMQGCKNAKGYLEVASTFDGREQLIEV